MDSSRSLSSYIAVGLVGAGLGAFVTASLVQHKNRIDAGNETSTSYSTQNGRTNGKEAPRDEFGSPVKVIKVFDDSLLGDDASNVAKDDQAIERQRRPMLLGCGPGCFCTGTPGTKKLKADPFDPSPRTGYLNWDDYFMSVAFLSSQRSKDPNKQVGACIVSKDNVILGIGYNGFPRGCPDQDLPWAKASRDSDSLKTKYPYVCHAEMNAIMNKNSASLEGAKMYVTMFPCNECAKLIIQAGIREVIFYEDKNIHMAGSPTKGGLRADPAYTASKTLFSLAGVKVAQHKPKKPTVIVL